MGGRDSFLIIRRVGMACQARGRKVRIIHHRESLYPRQRRVPLSILVTIGLWALGTLAIFLLSQGTLPFHLPYYQARGASSLGPLIGSESTLFIALAMIGLIFLVTARRGCPIWLPVYPLVRWRA